MTTNTNNTWEDMTDEERAFALRRAKEFMNGKKEDPFMAYGNLWSVRDMSKKALNQIADASKKVKEVK